MSRDCNNNSYKSNDKPRNNLLPKIQINYYKFLLIFVLLSKVITNKNKTINYEIQQNAPTLKIEEREIRVEKVDTNIFQQKNRST